MKAKTLLLFSVTLLMFTAAQSQPIERRYSNSLYTPSANIPAYTINDNGVCVQAQNARTEGRDVKSNLSETSNIFWIWWIKLRDRSGIFQPAKL